MGGDSDFWGDSDDHIFPMDVKIQGEDGEIDRVEVGIQGIGLNKLLIEETWKTWHKLFEMRSNLFGQTVSMLSEKVVFPKDFQEFIAEYLSQGRELTHRFDIRNLLNDIVGPRGRVSSDLLEDLRKSESMIDEAIDTSGCFEEERGEFLRNAQRLAEYLRQMYEQAKDFVGQEVYPYD